MNDCVLGIFVGGHGRRLGGVDKAALPAPGGSGSLLERALGLGRALAVDCVIVGQSPLSVPQDATEEVVRLQDDPAGIGPVGGLCALLVHAADRPALALACDMPYVGVELLRQLRQAPAAPVVAPRDPATGKWSPLCARYDSPIVLPAIRRAVAEGLRSFQACFQRLDVAELRLTPEDHTSLRDWDRPEDIP